MNNNIKVIFWDFDGVILESNTVREKGFREVLSSFSEEQVNELIDYHRKNGGLSRYVKFKFFYEDILKTSCSDEEITKLAMAFSEIMRSLLTDKENLIQETVTFIAREYQNYKMHIVSGSDQEELRYLCQELDIDKFFLDINGSPTHKNDLVKNLMEQYSYSKEKCILIGDSINDYEAAESNNIGFKAYNNESLNYLTNTGLEF